MTNDIKEILEHLNIPMNEGWACLLEDYQAHLLLDYITKLQNQLSEKTYLYNKLDTESKYVIIELEKQLKELKEDKDRVVSEREDLLSSCLYQDTIIKKSIGYIKDNTYLKPVNKCKHFAYYIRFEKETFDLNELLDILKDKQDNEKLEQSSDFTKHCGIDIVIERNEK